MRIIGEAVRARVSMYNAAVMVNKIPLEIKKPPSVKFESLSYVVRSNTTTTTMTSSNERTLVKASAVVHKGIVLVYEALNAEGGGKVIFSD